MIEWLPDHAPQASAGGSAFGWLDQLGAVEAHATGTLEDLVPEVRSKFDALIARAKSRGMQPKVRSVGRTCEQQQEQVSAGYSHADLCRSMHVLGHAVDLDLSPSTCGTYTELGQWWESQGGVWGGRWSQFGPCGDQGHFHYGFDGAGAVPTSVCPNGVTLDQCRRVRSDYLAEAFSKATGTRTYNALAIATFAVVGVVAALAYLRGA